MKGAIEGEEDGEGIMTSREISDIEGEEDGERIMTSRG